MTHSDPAVALWSIGLFLLLVLSCAGIAAWQSWTYRPREDRRDAIAAAKAYHPATVARELR